MGTSPAEISYYAMGWFPKAELEHELPLLAGAVKRAKTLKLSYRKSDETE
jgi:hypothetical protein